MTRTTEVETAHFWNITDALEASPCHKSLAEYLRFCRGGGYPWPWTSIARNIEDFTGISVSPATLSAWFKVLER